ncbi:hypothetical protein ESOG_04651 [Escherichia coli E101]|nr:hypothetical protein ESOG_04651 [Escherichia coli E101]
MDALRGLKQTFQYVFLVYELLWNIFLGNIGYDLTQIIASRW